MIDIEPMQAVARDAWRVAGPKVEWHVGDIAWNRWMHVGREGEWRFELRDGAWGWLRGGSELDWLVRPDLKGSAVQRDLLAWFESESESESEAEARDGAALQTWAFEDDAATAAVLADAGFGRRRSGATFSFNARELADEAEPRVPDGLRLRSVTAGDLARRVELHRAVWQGSRVTEESYANVMRAWPYRPELDCVVETADGRLVAYALAWLDDENRVGELEPVGTHPDFRRLGLAAAVCRYACAHLRDAGAERAIVYSLDKPAQHLYESIGFRRHSRLVGWTKDRRSA